MLMGLSFGLFSYGVEPIALYDLRYANRLDVQDAASVNRAWDHWHLVSALQGLVNRSCPRLFVYSVDSQILPQNIDQYWLEIYRKKGQWLADRAIEPISSLSDLLIHFKDAYKGLVVYDPAVPATSNIASAVAGADDLLPVRYDISEKSIFNLLTSELGISVKVWLVNKDGTSLFNADGKILQTDRFTSGSAKCDAYIWLLENYLEKGKLNPEFGAYYIDYDWTKHPARTVLNHHQLTNHDFFIGKRAFFFDLSPWADEPATDDPAQRSGLDREILQQLLQCAYRKTNGKKIIHIGGFPPWAFKYTKHAAGGHEDVAAEWEYTTLISTYNAFQDADAIGFGAIANSSFWQHFPLKERYPQKWVSREDLRKRGYLTEDGKVNFDGRKFIIFYVGDYDSSSWVYQRVMDIWEDPNRGKVPLMWAISPVLDRRIPMAMDYIRQTASPNDYFVAADNGAGYLNPGALQYHWNSKLRPISNLPSGYDAWASHCKKYYDRWGLTITGFVIDGYAEGMRQEGLDCYQSFSPNGLIWQKGAISLLYKNMPVLRADLDINQDDPSKAAKAIMDRSKEWPLPFHWFRNILKTPTWYVQVVEELKAKAPHLELLDAPTFFELYRIYLENNSEAAEGKYPQFMYFW